MQKKIKHLYFIISENKIKKIKLFKSKKLVLIHTPLDKNNLYFNFVLK